MELNEFFRDEKAVNDGVWIGELTGLDETVRLKVRGLTSRAYMNAFSRAQRKAPTKDREPDRSLTIDAVRRIMAELLPEHILLDWEGITQGGQPVPYDKEQVKQWLRQPGALPMMNAITEAAGRVDDLQAAEKAEVAKK